MVRRAGAQIEFQRPRNRVALGSQRGDGELDDDLTATLHRRQVVHARRNIRQRRLWIANIAASRQEERRGRRQKSLHGILKGPSSGKMWLPGQTPPPPPPPPLPSFLAP